MQLRSSILKNYYDRNNNVKFHKVQKENNRAFLRHVELIFLFIKIKSPR